VILATDSLTHAHIVLLTNQQAFVAYEAFPKAAHWHFAKCFVCLPFLSITGCSIVGVIYLMFTLCQINVISAKFQLKNLKINP
jgi:hypothetical protein